MATNPARHDGPTDNGYGEPIGTRAHERRGRLLQDCSTAVKTNPAHLAQRTVGGSRRQVGPQKVEHLIPRQAMSGGSEEQQGERAGRAARPGAFGNDRTPDIEPEGSEQVRPEWRGGNARGWVHGLKGAFRRQAGQEPRLIMGTQS